MYDINCYKWLCIGVNIISEYFCIDVEYMERPIYILSW